MRLRFLVRLNPTKSQAAHLPDATEVTFAPMEAISDGLGGLDVSNVRPLFEVASGSYSYFADGDILLAKVTPCFENGKKAIARGLASGIGFATSEVHVIRPDIRRIDTSYLRYLLCSEPFRAAGMASMTGAGGLRRVSEDAVLNFRVPIERRDAQKAIAEFLDRETVRIDYLIEKKEQLRALIAERRDVLVQEMLRTGARSSPWRSAALRRFSLSMCDGPFGSALKSEHYATGGVRVVRLQNIGRARFLGDDAVYIDQDYYATLGDHDVKPGDLLVAALGDPKNHVGRACIAPDDLGPAMVKADCFRVRLDQRQLRHDFVAIFLSSRLGADAVGRQSKGVTRERINLSILSSLIVPVPPMVEQEALVKAFKEADARATAVDVKMAKSIDRLRELRSALITAAVTGQIDVREQVISVTTELHRARFGVIVGAEIVQRHQGNPKFGRVKLQKLLYLAEAHAGIGELQGHYLREAAGPLDRTLIDETERGMADADFFRATQPDSDARSGVTYEPLAKAGQHRAELAILLSSRAEALRLLIDLLRDLDTRAAEAVATLYAVWNDALIDAEMVDDDAIVHAVLNDWHPEKRGKFKVADLRHWLSWMKRNDLVPSGKGPRTTSTMPRDIFA